jgi:hypothetical protein
MASQLNDNLETARFRAKSGKLQAFGRTPEEAFHALITRLPKQLPGPIIVWPFNTGDIFFTDAQQARLQELRSRRSSLTVEERRELESLIEAEFDATIARTQALPFVKS